MAGQEDVERFGLGHRSGETIEQESSLAAQAANSFSDQSQNGLVGNQIPPLHEFEGGLQGAAGRAIHRPSGTKDVPGRKVARAEITSQQISLGSFADPGRTQQDKTDPA